MFDWRARAAFYWLVGPFVVIGSVVSYKTDSDISRVRLCGKNCGSYGGPVLCRRRLHWFADGGPPNESMQRLAVRHITAHYSSTLIQGTAL